MSVVLSLAVVVLTSACGSSLPHDEIVAAWEGSAGAQGGSRTRTSGGGEALPGEDVARLDGDVTSSDPGTGGTGTSGGRTGGPTTGGRGGSGTTNTTAKAGPGGPGAPIRLGSVSSLTGPAGAAALPGVDAIRAWARAVNAKGGINGRHPVELFVVDDGADPTRHAAAVQDLVENKGVIAFVGQFATLTHDAARSYLERKGIPVVGGDSAAPVWFDSPMYFPGGGGRDPLGPFTKVLPVMTSGKKLAVLVCTETGICNDVRNQVHRDAPKAGYEIVYSGSGTLAQPDFTAQCIEMRDGQADVVIPIFDSASVLRLARSCARQGYFPKYWVAGATADASMATSAEFDGSGGGPYSFPFAGTESHPGAAEFFAAMAKYAPGVKLQPGTPLGWTSGKMFEKAAENVSAKPTSAEILNGLWQFRNETLGGIAVPLTFPQGKPAPSNRCTFVSMIRDRKWTAPRGMEPVCA